MTGAGSGIGKAVALALLKEGYSVVLAGRRPDPLKQAIVEAGSAANALAHTADVSDPASVAHCSPARSERFGRLDVLFNNAGISAPGVPLEDLTVEQWRSVVDTEPHRRVPLHAAGVRADEGSEPARRTHHQQRIDLGVRAAPELRALHGDQARASPGSRNRRRSTAGKYDIACSQIDIGNAATEMTARMAKGVPQANGEIAVEPLLDLDHVARAVVYMAGLPLDANVQFMTVMATKMPFIGRG